MATFNSDIKIDREPIPGFRSNGWAVWSLVSVQPYLAGIALWTSDSKQAHVFTNLDTAVATAECWSYFSCSTAIKVIAVIPGDDSEAE